jgi:hypothetical protein
MSDFVLPYGVFKRNLFAALLVIENRWWDGDHRLNQMGNRSTRGNGTTALFLVRQYYWQSFERSLDCKSE